MFTAVSRLKDKLDDSAYKTLMDYHSATVALLSLMSATSNDGLIRISQMKKTTRESGREGKIVNVSSEAHHFAYSEGVRFDKLNDPSRMKALKSLQMLFILEPSILIFSAITASLMGATTTCYVALHPQVKGVSGEYFSDSNLAKPTSQAQDATLTQNFGISA